MKRFYVAIPHGYNTEFDFLRLYDWACDQLGREPDSHEEFVEVAFQDLQECWPQANWLEYDGWGWLVSAPAPPDDDLIPEGLWIEEIN